MSMNSKKIVAEAMIAVALSFSALGLGAGSVQADPGWGPDIPWIPGPGDWVPDWDPGINWARPDRSRNGARGTPRRVTGLGVHTGYPVPADEPAAREGRTPPRARGVSARRGRLGGGCVVQAPRQPNFQEPCLGSPARQGRALEVKGGARIGVPSHSGTASDGEQSQPIWPHDNVPESPSRPEQYAVATEVLMLGGGDLDLPDSTDDGALINDHATVVRDRRVNYHRQREQHWHGVGCARTQQR